MRAKSWRGIVVGILSRAKQLATIFCQRKRPALDRCKACEGQYPNDRNLDRLEIIRGTYGNGCDG